MHTIPDYSNNASMPVWITLSEAVDIINRCTDTPVRDYELWRYALYGHLPLSIYFQSSVKIRKISRDNKNIILLDAVTDNLVDKTGMLSDICILHGGNRMVKTEGDYISPNNHIVDTPLLGYEHMVVQRLLAQALNIPAPVSGLYDFHYGVIVCEGDVLYQVFEQDTWENRISQRLKDLPSCIATQFHAQINISTINRKGIQYFPAHRLPDDALFVIKRTHLEHFINQFFLNKASANQLQSPTLISTPVARFLWLACRHNTLISQLIDHPYKLVSIFEQWASEEGITDRFSGDTLKKALKRGSPQ
ncbi:TPA: hypothetical protein JAN03_24300 [Citrobacter freundii]|nr:hypothetical protein [Citrobacter freundii]